MENNNGITILNGITIAIFSLMAFIGVIGVFERLGNTYNVVVEDLSYLALFVIGSLGLIVELLIYNLKALKNK